jgi:hypothetical protein
VENFSRDVSDGENYTVLLNQLKPDQCSRDPLQTKDLHQRAEQVLAGADRIGCRRFLSPNSLVAGNPKLNLAFVANLFNTWPGLEPLQETEAPPEIEDFDAEGEREARVFTLWLNSLDVEPGVYNLFEDLKVGLLRYPELMSRMDTSSFKGSTRSFQVALSGDEYLSPKKAKSSLASKLWRIQITRSISPNQMECT